MLLSDETHVKVIVSNSAIHLSEGSFKLFPLRDNYFILLQYSQLQFSKAVLLPVKRYLSFTFPLFLVVFFSLQNS